MRRLILTVFFLFLMILSWKEGRERVFRGESFLKKRNDESSKEGREFSQKKRNFLEPIEEVKIAENKEEFIDFFKKESSLYFNLRRKAFSKKDQKDLLHNILEDKEKFDSYMKVLLNLNLIKDEGSENQAYMRILALSLIIEKARLGDMNFLEEMARKLISNQGENKTVKGTEEDILDLMIAWLEMTGKERVSKEPSLFFEAFIYHTEERELFSKALSYFDPTLFWDKNSSSHFQKILSEGLFL